MKHLIHSIIIAAVLANSCTAFKKQIVKPVIVALPDTLFSASQNAVTAYPKYLDHATLRAYAQAFLKGFKSEAAITKNITLQYHEQGADLVLKVRSLVLTETTRTEKISDPKSPYNGMDIELNSVECDATLEIRDVKKNKLLNDAGNSKMRSEQFTNNRTLDDLVSGKNKDKSQYRTKLLDEAICLHLSEDVGRRIWTPVTRRIAGDLK